MAKKKKALVKKQAPAATGNKAIVKPSIEWTIAMEEALIVTQVQQARIGKGAGLGSRASDNSIPSA